MQEAVNDGVERMARAKELVASVCSSKHLWRCVPGAEVTAVDATEWTPGSCSGCSRREPNCFPSQLHDKPLAGLAAGTKARNPEAEATT